MESAAERQARLYEEAMGRPALMRQEEHSFWRFPCCWELKETEHHPFCRLAPQPEPRELQASFA